MIPEELIDTLPRCPYCGHGHGDAWEWGPKGEDEENGERQCEECEHTFYWRRSVSVSYITRQRDVHSTCTDQEKKP